MKDLTRRYLRLFKSSLRLRLKKLGIFFNKSWPFWAILLIVCTFFWKVFLLKQVPLPADIAVGAYYPWLDYKWGYPVGVPVKNPITTDSISFTYPMRILAIDLMKGGQLPLWNPYILAGTPLLANFQSAPFSPTNIFYFIFDKLTAWSLQILAQHFLGAIFVYFLLRGWKVSRLGSLFGGTIFAFTGFNLIWSQWNAHVLVASFIPLILFFEDKWLIEGGWRNGMGLSLSLFFQILSGYPQLIFYSFLAMGILWLVRTNKKKIFVTRTFFLAIFIVLGLALASFQILPGNELLSLSQREIEPLPVEWAFLPASKIVTFFAPDFFGNHATGNYWGPQDYTSNTGFVGVTAFIFAMVALSLTKKKKEVFFAVLLSLVSFFLALATPLSVFLLKSGVLGFQAASAHRILVLFNLGIALLAGFGLDNFFRQKKVSFLKYALIPLMVILTAGVYASQIHPVVVRGIVIPKVALRNLVFPSFILLSLLFVYYFFLRRSLMSKKLFVVFVFLLMIFELFRFGWKFTPFSPRHIVFPKTPVLEFLVSQERPFRVTASSIVPVNLLMPYEIEILEGYDAVYPLRISQFISSLNSGRSDTSPQGRYGIVDNLESPLLNLSNTKYLVVGKKEKDGGLSPRGDISETLKNERFKLVLEDKSVAVLENKESLPRAFMVYDWQKLESDQDVLGTLLEKDFKPIDILLLEEDIGLERTRGGKANSTVLFESYKETESLLRVSTSRDGLLFVSDTWYPGWEAYVDGRKTKIYRANYAFRGIKVPSGEHKVKFVYRPASFFNGLRVTAVAFFLLILISLLSNIINKQGKKGFFQK